MTDFRFVGRLPASKSILNRLLIAGDYFPQLTIEGESEADDVRLMIAGLRDLAAGRPVEVGAAGTTLRFLALRASRRPGRHLLRGHRRLFARPQDELVQILAQLGVAAQLGEASLEIEGEGWRPRGDTVVVPSGRSSQFATAVLVNAWDLPFDLYCSLNGAGVSRGYWRMSVKLCESLGMKMDFWDDDFRVSRGAVVNVPAIGAEIDLSSAFAVAGLAAVAGRATLLGFPRRSLQPDAVFVEILGRMGVPIDARGDQLDVSRAPRLNGVAVNLRHAPDLFPVLATLAALAHGESQLLGAPHLIHKESDRLRRVADLVRQMGRAADVHEDGLVVRGSEPARPHGSRFTFDCDQDHRLAFAAAVARAAGFAIDIEGPEVVTKSFPDFWRVVGGASPA